LQNPTISAVISEFEDVCFPFISHETELTPEQDREVFQSRMIEAGYALGEEKKWKQHTQYGETPVSSMYCPSQPTYVRRTEPRVEGKFTVFPARDKIIESQDPTDTLNCEILGIAFFKPLRTDNYTRQNYKKVLEKPIFATLLWQDMTGLPDLSIKQKLHKKHYSPTREYKVRSSFLPASSCVIDTRDETLTAASLESAIISKDPDWIKRDVKDNKTKAIIPEAHSWTQCSKQDEESYVYSVSLIRGSFSMTVKTLKDDENEPDYNCGRVAEEG